MKNKKIWDVLILTGNAYDIELFSTYINDKSLGSQIIEDKYFYYFDNEKETIQNILNKYIKQYNINFYWDIKKDEDWHLKWKDNFQPIKINEELIIVPDWDQNDYSYNNKIKIKPGMAFGTGHHETTFLMLKHLINNIKKNDTILDLGSGSGILSIAANLYGASKIIAVENDSVCEENFLENLALNNMNPDKIKLIIEDVTLMKNFDYDIILANINKNVIQQLIPKFQHTSARIFISGILVEDKMETISLFDKYNIKLVTELQYNEWILMEIKNG